MLEKIYRTATETTEDKIPNISAWFLVNFPVGIGRRQVLVINESKSDSYHMFSAPAAPEPKATARREYIALKKLILV